MAMADCEFQESEVIFSENHKFESFFDFRHPHPHNKPNLKKKKMGNDNIYNKKSLPVKIPNHLFDRFGGSDGDDSDGDYYKEEEWDEGELVPPHVIVRRRIEGKMAFSVCTGNGRTLKGRDLSRVRNSILRMTGFLEA